MPATTSATVSSDASLDGDGRDGGLDGDAVKMSVDADLADLGLLLVRTEPGSTGRDGLSCFAFALDQPTVSVQRLSSGAAVVVWQGATVSADDLIGERGGGWAVAQTILAHQTDQPRRAHPPRSRRHPRGREGGQPRPH